MKILHVSNAYKPSFETGGVARSCYEISKSLAKMGHDVTVYTTDRGENRVDVGKNRPVVVDGVQVYYFRNISNSLSMNFKFITPYYAPLIAKKQIKNFDIIHIHEHRTLLAAIVSHYAKQYDVPYVVQPRGSAQKVQKSLQKTLFDNISGYKVLKGAKKILLSSKNEYQLSKSVLDNAGVVEKDLSYIPNGIDISQVSAGKKDFRKKYGIEEKEKIILYLGRISKRKGLDLLVKAFEELAHNEDDYRLVIVGPKNPYLDELKSMINKLSVKEKIMLPGPLYEEGKYSAYSATDVFVLPSKDQQESFGNVVLEAGSCGTPCVATNVCGVTEWMDNVIKVDPDVESISKGIENGLKTKELGQRSRKEVYDKFSWNSIVEDQLVPIYDDVSRKDG